MHTSAKLWTFVAITLICGLVIGLRYGIQWSENQPVETVWPDELYNDPGEREEVACPAPDDSFVLVLFGQSNSSNNVGHRFSPSADRQVLNRYAGKCYLARDPMLGATGERGSIAIPLAEAIATDKTVVIDAFGVSGSAVVDWLDGGRVADHFSARLQELDEQEGAPDFFVWVQGEANTQTDPAQYREQLFTLMDGLQAAFPNSPIGLTGTTYCKGRENPQILAAQRSVSEELGLIFLLETDRLRASEDRYDDCHLSERGARKVAASIAESINAHLAGQ